MNRVVMVLVCLIGIVIGSGLLGGLIGWRAGLAHAIRRGDPGYWADDAVARLRTRLDLTPAQVAAVSADIDQAAATLTTLRAETDRRTAAAIAGLAATIDAHLDPRQRGEFARMRAEPPAAGLDLLRLPQLPAGEALPAGPGDPAPAAPASSSGNMAAAIGLPPSDQVVAAVGLPSPQALTAALPDFGRMRADLGAWLHADPAPAAPAVPTSDKP